MSPWSRARDATIATTTPRARSSWSRWRSRASVWIVNLAAPAPEVYREPRSRSRRAVRWRYASRESLDAASTVAPLAVPTARIAISQLLP